MSNGTMLLTCVQLGITLLQTSELYTYAPDGKGNPPQLYWIYKSWIKIVLFSISIQRRRICVRLQGIRLKRIEELCCLGSMIKKAQLQQVWCEEQDTTNERIICREKQPLASSIDVETNKCFQKAYDWSIDLYRFLL